MLYKKEKNYGKKLKKIQKICLQRGLYAGNASPRQERRKRFKYASFRHKPKTRFENRASCTVFITVDKKAISL
ncbi:hypothetical protein HMPREF9193_01330 [Treponema lecithinolyticum ATCC 700332]|uniref:Uncharacterized protein n=1 Tax=Treponema lecithinolyticum ATCC 700332 TaxID=1321815 RepID=A0ABN0NY35_TRELE|nr:hypothetical protein HMPREF9193_01330 [Treponema lecithinolyticum ATCC 700332]